MKGFKRPNIYFVNTGASLLAGAQANFSGSLYSITSNSSIDNVKVRIVQQRCCAEKMVKVISDVRQLEETIRNFYKPVSYKEFVSSLVSYENNQQNLDNTLSNAIIAMNDYVSQRATNDRKREIGNKLIADILRVLSNFMYSSKKDAKASLRDVKVFVLAAEFLKIPEQKAKKKAKDVLYFLCTLGLRKLTDDCYGSRTIGGARLYDLAKAVDSFFVSHISENLSRESLIRGR